MATTFFLLLLPLLSYAADGAGFEMGPEKQTHVHFFSHDIFSGSNPTATRIAAAPNTTAAATGFGAVTMVDVPLTEGPAASSKLLGKAQGFYAAASMAGEAPLMTVNLYFSDGDWKGSSLAVVGRNAASGGASREVPVLGGSGQFRWAEGYALAKTERFDAGTGDATTEYDVYVTHRCADRSKCSPPTADGSSAVDSGGSSHRSSALGGRSVRLGVGFGLAVLVTVMILNL